MALQSVWYYSNLPEDIVNIIERDRRRPRRRGHASLTMQRDVRTVIRPGSGMRLAILKNGHVYRAKGGDLGGCFGAGFDCRQLDSLSVCSARGRADIRIPPADAHRGRAAGIQRRGDGRGVCRRGSQLRALRGALGGALGALGGGLGGGLGAPGGGLGAAAPLHGGGDV